MSNLPFENQLLVDTFSDDCLFVFAHGMGLEQTVLNHLKLYSDPKVLVLVINTTTADEHFYAEQLNKCEVDCPPKFVTSDVGINDRKSLYLTGGVHFVTSRILVVDMLMDRIPAELISGIVVYRAHQILDSFQESFILRMYRQKKKDGFVKAFTDSPTLIGDGNVGQMQRLVRSLYVRRVQLIPRFEADVKQQLHERQPEVIEVTVELSPAMKKIQSSLLELIGACIKELKQCNPTLIESSEEDEGDSSTLIIAASFYDSPLERKLSSEEYANQLSDKSKRLLDDLIFLRRLLKQMEQLDPTTFYQSLQIFKSDQKEFQSNSGWLFTPSASKLFQEALFRINVPSHPKQNSDESQTKTHAKKEPEQKSNQKIEVPPKWDALYSVLTEVKDTYADLKQRPEAEEQHVTGSVLFVVENTECGRQLADLLRFGTDRLLGILKSKNLRGDAESIAKDEILPSSTPWWDELQIVTDWEKGGKGENDRRSTAFNTFKDNQTALLRKGKGKKGKLEEGQISLDDFSIPKRPKLTSLPETDQLTTSSTKTTEKTEVVMIHLDENPTKTNLDNASGDSSETKGGTVTEPLIPRPDKEGDPLLWFVNLEGQKYTLLKSLELLDPTFVIFYHVNLMALRVVEVFKARRCTGAPLRLYSIQYKNSAEEQRYLNALNRENKAFQFLMHEKGIVVDMREFRSELPLLIYKRGIDIVPVTLEVGDYILTLDTCVERKSLADLAASLANGRLYAQAEKMIRHYRKVLVLIEGSGGRGGSKSKSRWSDKGAFTGDMGPSSRDIRGKLTMLVRAFPQLSLIWTSGPQSSVEIFEELKWEKSEPDSEAAAAIKWDEGGVGVSGTKQHNPTHRNMLLKLPGVTEKNVQDIMQGGGNLLTFMNQGINSQEKFSESVKQKLKVLWNKDLSMLIKK